MDKKLNLGEQAREIMQIAEKHGVEQNYFFMTTFKRYQVQLKILQDLEKEISKSGILVTKEYVKGRGNLYTHPAVNEYNKTSTAANQTVATLVKIITTLRKGDERAGDELLEFLRG
jgi:predicted secreted Zn-dependent protease